ncbi:hypothetical protein CTA2_12779 [Colletotrichum tanaceti]|uniref:Uncharacterized protein n=1 Tax=Colletotrichum tanaceti TaxID=1306861 RepID=A0A4U6XIZ4_9PEZI|nr:hypothetical protein CTA2_12779 [Colletotrichum tanaceti]TKW55865.1 hypothetical protein CTA1_11720 [Colletotrichum tanaceti]
MQHSYKIFRSWIWELLSVVIAIGLVIAIAALLATYEGKPAPDWGAHLNLNALLALLSTILRALLVVVVSGVISQRKWGWYGRDRDRPLSDLQQFDTGSRGSLGALLLIPTVVLKDVVALVAAVVLLASFLVGPFTQQASQTVDCSFPVPNVLNASIPFAHHVPRKPLNTHRNAGPLAVEPDVVIAVLSGVTAAGGVENQVSASCTTGHCTFSIGDPPEQDVALNISTSTTHSTVGMCSKCTDVASLISRMETGDPILPNGFNLSNEVKGAEGHSALMDTASDFIWLGDMLTPDLRALSRWAYVNVTFLTNESAAVCHLYPCMRTYISSVIDNQLVEQEVRSDIMLVEDGAALLEPLQAANSHSNEGSAHYTTVKSPCRADEKVYNALQNTSTRPGATKLALCDFTDYGGLSPTPYRSTCQNITAPDQCIYRQDATFVKMVSMVLNDHIFSGICTYLKSTLHCAKSGWGNTENDLADLGAGTVLRALYNDHDPSFPTTDRWFQSFADAMTNRYRFQFGSPALNLSRRQETPPWNQEILPLGQIQGLTWQSMVCVSMRREWLLLPVCLTLITAALSIWTMADDWRHRHHRPVWKDSVLPLIFYRHKFESQERGALPNQPRESTDDEDGAGAAEQRNGLLEATEMKDLGFRIPVTFQWPENVARSSTDGVDTLEAFALQQLNDEPRRRSPRDRDNESLLETDVSR